MTQKRVIIMTSFEKWFAEFKSALETDDVYHIWPKFNPEYDREEYSYIEDMGKLRSVLIFNCGSCDGPSDPRHNTCRECINSRAQYVKSKEQKNFDTIMLSRIYTGKAAGIS